MTVLIAVILLRVSTERQVRKKGDYGSLEKQEEEAKQVINKEGWKYLTKFVDAAEQGDDENRPGLRALEEAAAKGECNRVVVWKQSRLGRGITIIRRVVGRLEAFGVQIFDVNGQRITVSGGKDFEIERTLNQAYADEMELLRIRHGAKSDRRRTAQSGWWRGAVPPMGYIIDTAHRDTRLLIEPRYAPYIEQVFLRIISGQTKRKVVEWLRGEGVVTPAHIVNKSDRGSRPIMEKHVIAIIRNPVYMGCVKVSHYSECNAEGEPPLGINAHGVAIFAGQHEGIVTPAKWIEANDALDSFRKPRKRRTADKQGNYLVQGLISCACGCDEMKTPSGHGIYRQYVAKSANHSHGLPCRCKIARMSAPIVDDCVLTLLQRAANKPEIHEELMNEFRAQQCRKRKGKKLQELMAEEANLKAEVANVTNTLRRCQTDDARCHAAGALDQATSELRAVVCRRKQEELLLLSDGGKSIVSEAEFLTRLTQLKDTLKAASRPEQKDLVQECVASVVVRPITAPGSVPKIFEIVVRLDPKQFRCGASVLTPLSAQVRLDSRTSYSFVEPFTETRSLETRGMVSPEPEPEPAANSSHPLDRLVSYKAMLAAGTGMTMTALAAKIGMTKGHVSQVLSLDRIPSDIRERIARHKSRFTLRSLLRIAKLSPSHAIAEVGFIVGPDHSAAA